MGHKRSSAVLSASAMIIAFFLLSAFSAVDARPRPFPSIVIRPPATSSQAKAPTAAPRSSTPSSSVHASVHAASSSAIPAAAIQSGPAAVTSKAVAPSPSVAAARPSATSSKAIAPAASSLFVSLSMNNAPLVAGKRPVTGKWMPDTNTRAMWFWGKWPEIAELAVQDGLFSVIAAPHDVARFAINRFYFEFGRANLQTDAVNIRAFLRRAHALGIAVEYLDGNPIWLIPANNQIPVDICSEVAKFNAGGKGPEEWIDGIHFDIEPHVNRGQGLWRGFNTAAGKDQYNDALESAYVSIMKNCRAVLNAAGGRITLAADVGDDYAQQVTDLWQPLMANRYLDYIGIMNYYDTLDRFLFGVKGIGGMYNVLARSPVPVVFGAETIQPGSAPDANSFWQEGYLSLEWVLAQATAQANNPLFAGVAVHHFASASIMQAGTLPAGMNPALMGSGDITCMLDGQLYYDYSTKTVREAVQQASEVRMSRATTGNLVVTGLPLYVGCAMRSDTYKATRATISGSAAAVSLTGVPRGVYLELYNTYNGPTDCSGYMGSVCLPPEAITR
eukprot:Opistho-2@65642